MEARDKVRVVMAAEDHHRKVGLLKVRRWAAVLDSMALLPEVQVPVARLEEAAAAILIRIASNAAELAIGPEIARELLHMTRTRVHATSVARWATFRVDARRVVAVEAAAAWEEVEECVAVVLRIPAKDRATTADKMAISQADARIKVAEGEEEDTAAVVVATEAASQLALSDPARNAIIAARWVISRATAQAAEEEEVVAAARASAVVLAAPHTKLTSSGTRARTPPNASALTNATRAAKRHPYRSATMTSV